MAKINLKYEHGAKYRANKCIRSNASYNPVRAKRYLRAPQLSVNNKCGEHNNQVNAYSTLNEQLGTFDTQLFGGIFFLLSFQNKQGKHCNASINMHGTHNK